jgi:hypothetical protein
MALSFHHDSYLGLVQEDVIAQQEVHDTRYSALRMVV